MMQSVYSKTPNDILRLLCFYFDSNVLHSFVLLSKRHANLLKDDKFSLRLMSSGRLITFDVHKYGGSGSYTINRKLPNDVYHGLQVHYVVYHKEFYLCHLRYGIRHGTEVLLRLHFHDAYVMKWNSGKIIQCLPSIEESKIHSLLSKHSICRRGFGVTRYIDLRDNRGLFPKRIWKKTYGYRIEVYHQNGKLQMKGGLVWEVFNKRGEVVRSYEHDDMEGKAYTVRCYKKNGTVIKQILLSKDETRTELPNGSSVLRTATNSGYHLIFRDTNGKNRRFIEFNKKGLKDSLDIRYDSDGNARLTNIWKDGKFTDRLTSFPSLPDKLD